MTGIELQLVGLMLIGGIPTIGIVYLILKGESILPFNSPENIQAVNVNRENNK